MVYATEMLCVTPVKCIEKGKTAKRARKWGNRFWENGGVQDVAGQVWRLNHWLEIVQKAVITVGNGLHKK
jgi:hypothetical protein